MAQEVKGLTIELGLNASDFKKEMESITSNLKSYQKDLSAINKVISSQPDNIDAWRRKQETLNKIVEETRKEQELLTKRLKEAANQVSSGNLGVDEYNKLQRELDYCTANLNKYNNQLEQANNKIKNLRTHVDTFNKIGSSLNSIGDKLTKNLTLPITAATTAIIGLTTSLANSIDEMNDTASKAGLSVEAYQKWAYTAEILAVDSNQLYKAFVKVNSLLGDIASGRANTATEALESIGITVDELKGKNTEEAFELIRDALSNLEDQALRTDIANQIFGDRLGSELAQVLGATTDQIEALKNEANELGIATSEQAEIAGDFNDELLKLKMSFQGVGYEVMELVLPSLQSLSEYIRDNLISRIQVLIDKWNSLSDSTKKTIGVIAGAAVAIGPTLKVIGTLITLGTSLTTVVKGIGTALTGISTALGPIGIAITAIISILALAYTQSESMREVLNGLIECFTNLLDPLSEIIDTLIDGLSPILEIISDILTQLFELLAPILEVILLPLELCLKTIAQVLEIISPALNFIFSIIQALAPLLQVVLNILTPILNVLNSIFDTITNIINSIIDFVDNSVIGDFLDWIGFDVGSLRIETSSSSGNSSTYNNNVNVYTTSSTFDIDSINEALGGKLV